ncbi:LOW QUALITY PROTEIN: hypothetical protein HID58_053787, partial [Brassica napus]
MEGLGSPLIKDKKEEFEVTGVVQDLKTIGGLYTWNGNRSKYNIRTRIDRAMATCEWLDLYPTAHVKLLPWIGSDHKPLLVDTESIKCNRKKQFRYDNRWRFEPGVKNIVKEVLEKCRNALSRWRSQNPRNTERRINQLKQEIEQAYQALDIDYAHINMLKAELSLQYRLEEEYWRTKSRVQWLQAGDRNTRFFHSKTKQRRSNNRIIHISDEEGKSYMEVKDTHNQIIKYFQELYKMFCRATEDECRVLMQTLREYQRASGQAVNFAKSAITFAKGIPQITQENLMRMTGIAKIGGRLPEKIGRRRKDAFDTSYGWRSILQARSLLQEGIKWIVGDGSKIRVWEDNWIHTQPAKAASGPGKEAFPYLKARDLMIEGTKSWNEHLIISAIRCSIYPQHKTYSSAMNQDTPIWNFTKTGEYTVRSGYHLCNQIRNCLNLEDQGNQSVTEAEALRIAVTQMRALAFDKVHFFSDCKAIMDELAQYITRATTRKVRNTESISMIQDIVEAAKDNGFTFSYMTRSSLSLVDELAKKAR